MAEQVQEMLDSFVAPLADLMDRNIFSQSEIHAIVARRRESEYLLRRRNPRKADFLRYIQDELQLEKLRQLRTKKQNALERERLAKLGRLEDDSMVQKLRIGDSHIIQHIHLLFRKTLRKYNKDDVSIYLQYADVCKELKSWNKLPQVYAEAVQIHPREPNLWIEAASHEFFHRQSVSTARVLLQRALRVNKKSKDLWLQSFALEFHHIAKMKGRRAVLQLESTEKDNQDTDLDSSSSLYHIAKIIYDNAIQAIPCDVFFRLSFLDLCCTFPFTDSMEAYIVDTIKRDFKDTPKAWIARVAHVLEQQQSKGRGEEQAGFRVVPQDNSEDEGQRERPAKKRRTRADSKDVTSNEGMDDPVLCMLREGVKTVASSEMYLEAVRFAWRYWEEVDQVSTDPKIVANTRINILAFIQDLLEDAAADSDLYSPLLVLEHANYFVRRDNLERAQEILENYVEKASNIHSSVWLRLTDLTNKLRSASAAKNVLKRALKQVPMNHPDYLKFLLESLGAEIAVAADVSNNSQNKNSSVMHEDVTDIFQRILLLAPRSSVPKPSIEGDDELEVFVKKTTPFGLASVADSCLHFLMYAIRALGALHGVRHTCKLVLYQSNFMHKQGEKTAEDMETLGVFFDKCLEVELSNLKNNAAKSKAERKRDRACLRQLYERAISLFSGVSPLAAKYQQERNEAMLL